MSAIYDFPEQFEGDTLKQRVFSIKRNVNGEVMSLDGASVSFEVYRTNTSKIYLSKSTADGGVEILDNDLCIIKINKILNPDLTPYEYLYKVTIQYANGDVRTYLNGKMPIVKFNTRKYVYSSN